VLAQRVCITLKLLRHEMPNFIIAPRPVASQHIRLQSCWLQNLGNATGVGLSTSYARCR